MRRTAALPVAAELSVGDHACWPFRGEQSWVEAATPYLAAGVVAGDRLLYVGSGSRATLTAALAALPGRDALLASGQLDVATLDEAYGEPGTFDPTGPLTRYADEGAASVAAGYRSLRIAADATQLARTADAAEHMAAYEVAVDRAIGGAPVTALCGYDADAVGAGLDALLCVHPTWGTAAAAPAFTAHWSDAALCLTGEIDTFATTELELVLRAGLAASGDTLLLDLTGVRFLDVGAGRTLAAFSEAAQRFGRSVLLDVSVPVVRRCLELFPATERALS